MPPSQEDLFKYTGFGFSATDRDNLSLSDAFILGLNIGYLMEAGEQQHQIGKSSGEKVLGTLTFVKDLLDSRDIDTPVTGKVAQFKTKIANNYDDFDASLSVEDGAQLEREATAWISVLEQNLENERRIPAADTGLMEVEGLLESPESLFSTPIWNWLHERPQSDIKEACKSIVIDSPTASVMLSLRAAEHCLREWHEDQTGESLEAAWGRVLGQLINEYLDDESTNKSLQQQLSELPIVLSNLYYLKEKRNEVNHPQESPTNAEARRTLMLSVGTITEIYHEMVEEVEAKYEGVELSISKDQLENKEDVVLEVMYELDEGDGARAEDIKHFSQEFGFGAEEVDAALQSLLMSGHIYEPGPEKFKPI